VLAAEFWPYASKAKTYIKFGGMKFKSAVSATKSMSFGGGVIHVMVV
jgi:hypothetical protein